MQSNQDKLDRLYAISSAFRAQYVEYDQLRNIREDLRMLVNRDNRASEGAVMTLMGVPGSGKTHFINSFVADYPRQKHAIVRETPEGIVKSDRATVVLVEMPDTGVKSVVQAIYEGVTQSQLKDARRYDIEDAIAHYAEEQETKLIILEEAHDAGVDNTSKTLKAVARLLRRMANKALFSILIVGTEEAAQLVESNRELHRRHLGFHTIQPSDWNNPADRAFFTKLLRTWDNFLQEGFAPSGLGQPEIAAKIAAASGGVIGTAAVLLERAGTFAARDVVAGRSDHITEAHFWAAYDGRKRAGDNPFAKPGSRQTVEGTEAPKTPAVKLSTRRAAPDRNFRT